MLISKKRFYSKKVMKIFFLILITLRLTLVVEQFLEIRMTLAEASAFLI